MSMDTIAPSRPPAPLVIAAIQMVSQLPISEAEPEQAIKANLAIVQRLVAQAASEGAQLIVLPENLLTFGSKTPFCLEQQKCWLKAFSALAKKEAVWLVAGSLPLFDFKASPGTDCESLQWQQDSGLPYATALVIDANGKLQAAYRKMHLFDANVADATGRYRESDLFRKGGQPLVVQTPWGKMGVGICFDLRFPLYFHKLREMKADFVVLPSAFTYTTGQAHWEILLRARAIENQFAIVGVNQGGEHDSKRKTWGDSMIVDAWGAILARAGDADAGDGSQLGEHIVLAELTFTQQHNIRAKMPLTTVL